LVRERVKSVSDAIQVRGGGATTHIPYWTMSKSGKCPQVRLFTKGAIPQVTASGFGLLHYQCWYTQHGFNHTTPNAIGCIVSKGISFGDKVTPNDIFMAGAHLKRGWHVESLELVMGVMLADMIRPPFMEYKHGTFAMLRGALEAERRSAPVSGAADAMVARWRRAMQMDIAAETVSELWPRLMSVPPSNRPLRADQDPNDPNHVANSLMKDMGYEMGADMGNAGGSQSRVVGSPWRGKRTLKKDAVITLSVDMAKANAAWLDVMTSIDPEGEK